MSIKKLLLITSLLSCYNYANAFSWGPVDSEWLAESPHDKIAHVSFAAPAAWYISRETGCPWIGSGSMTLLGTVNELTDLNFSRPDLNSWIIGGAIGSLTSYYQEPTKKCGKNPYEQRKLNALNTGSKILNVLSIVGANPYITIGAGIVGTFVQWNIDAYDVQPTDDWPFHEKMKLNSSTNSWLPLD